MGQVTVDGLGVVEIKGDWPTAEEDLKIQALLAKRTAEPATEAATPEQIEGAGLGGLAETLRGFRQIEDPREAGGAGEQALRALGAGASRVVRGALLETGLAAAEAVLGREEVEQSPSFALHEEWKALEEGLYKQSVSFDDVLESGWDPATVLGFIGESGVSSLPGMAAAVVSMPRYALSMVGDIAQQRAANRGRGEGVTGADLVAAAVTSGLVATGERFGGKLAKGGGSGATPLRRVGQAFIGEAATEAAQEAVQTIGEQAFTREGEGLVAGVDPTEMAKRMAAGALVGGPMGGVMSTGVEGGRALRRATRPPTEPTTEAEVVTEEVITRPASEVEAEYTQVRETLRAVSQDPRFDNTKHAEDLNTRAVELAEELQAARASEAAAPTETEAPPTVIVEPEAAPAEEVVAEEVAAGAGAFFGLYEERTSEHPADDRYRVWEDGQTALFKEFDEDPGVSDVHLEMVKVFRDRVGQGAGSKILREITKMADATGVTVSLEATAKGGPLTTGQLVEWYGRHGFKAHPEYGDEGLMVRTPAEEVAETVLRVVPGAEPGAKRTLVPRRTPREQVEADTDVAVRRVEADRALAEEIASVPTRPRTGEVEPRTARAQTQATLDQADVDVDTAASDPSASLADIVEKQARTAGLHSDANNASNADTRAFLEEMFPDDPGRVKKTMSQDRVPVSQALFELQARDLHTRTPDDFTVKTTDPFDAMVDDIIATGRNADHVEKLAFGHAKVQHRRVYRNLLQQYDRAETQAERDNLSEKISNVRDASDRIATANAKASRAWGLAGRYTQFFLDKDLTIVEALAKAKVDKGGLELSKSQRDFIEREYAASDKLEARAKPIRQAAIKKMRALSRVIRRLEGKASPTKRDAKLLKEAKRRYDKAEGVVVVADHDIRAAKSIRLNAVDKSQAGAILSPTASNAVQDVFDASRALRSSGEDSALGRQGMNLLARSLFTKEQAWIKTIPPALKMLASAVVNNPAGRARARRLQQELVDQPYQAVFDLAGGEVTDVEGVGGRHGGTLDAKQEEFATNLFNRLGGFGRAIGERLIEPSQNAYALTLNLLRRDYFDRALKKRLTEANIPPDLSATELVKAVKADPQLLADLESDAYMTNVFTGRGKWRIGTEGDTKGKGGKDIAGVLARRLLYAPRYMTSIIENALRTIPSAALTGLLTRRSWTKPLNYKNYPEWFKKLKDREYDPKVLPLMMSGVGPFKDVSDYQRGRLMGEAIFETAWLGSLAALAMIGFGDDEDEISWWERLRRFNDPESADYRKLVIGNWHVSLEGGRGATMRHLMPYSLSESEADDMAGMDFGVDYSRRIGRMLRNKTHPFVSPWVEVLSNEDYLGEPLTDQTYEEAKDNVHDMLVHLGQRSIPVALAFAPIIAESMGEAIGEGMAETGIPGAVPPDPGMADPDAPSLLNRLLVTGGTNMFGLGAQYYDPEEWSQQTRLPGSLPRLPVRGLPRL